MLCGAHEFKGKKLIHDHYIWILIFLAVFVAVYLIIQHMVMRSGKKDEPAN